METKKWYQSSTLLFNIVALVVAVLALPEFISVLPEVWLPFVAVIGAIGNTVLRFKTTQGIAK